MKAISRKIPVSETKTAFRISMAGPSSIGGLEMNSIVQPEAVLRVTLRAILRSKVAVYVLVLGESKTQSTPEGVRGKMSNLVHLRKGLAANCEEDVPC